MSGGKVSVKAGGQSGSVERHLAALLDQRDEEIEELRGRLRDAEFRVESSASGWSLPREIPDTYPSLPLPRLEVDFTPGEYGWSSYTVEYRMVHKHLCDHLVATPLGSTKVNGYMDRSPFDANHAGETVPPENALPFRDGAHAMHDAAHLGLPLYVLTPSGPVRVDGRYEYQSTRGKQHRRMEGGEL